MTEQYQDYASSGLTICDAFKDLLKRFPDKNKRPNFILWGGRQIKTGESITVPKHGIIKTEFLSSPTQIEQGFDLAIKGWFLLEKGEKVRVLRTWNDPRYESFVEYPFYSQNGLINIWNVYKVKYQNRDIIEEKWTENAGFWVEVVNETERIYHCSPGNAYPPDFESLIFKITVMKAEMLKGRFGDGAFKYAIVKNEGRS